MTTATEKDKQLELILANIEKQYGKGSIFSGSSSLADVEFIPTGCISLDKALGGGVAKGRIIEIYGPESTGKTTLALHVAAEVQNNNGVVAFIDAEHALDLNYAKALGVNDEKLIISQPDSAEQALNITDMLVESGAVDLIVIDSVAALVPQAEIEGNVGDSHMGLQARLMGQTLRKITGAASRAGCTIIFINQLRMKIGIMFGNPETTAGGNALKFYASQRIDIRKAGVLKMGEEIVGQETKIKIVKNKVAPPYKETTFNLEHGHGINKFTDLLRAAVEKDIVEKSGAWYSYKGERVGQGEANSTAFLASNPKIYKEIYDSLR